MFTGLPEEALMKKLTIVAALLLVTSAANAGNSISFEIEGHKIRIEAPKDCDSLSCIQVSAPSLSGSGFKSTKSPRNRLDDSDVAMRADPPSQKSAPVEPSAAPQPVAPADANPAASPVVASPSTAPSVTNDVAPAAPAVTSASPKQGPAAAAPATPLGVWATEENKGAVRIEACGQNLCGYAVKTGEKILINMKPSDAKWVGQIHDPDSGKNYDSNIAMKGPNTLRVQGCAFGGMFCGGQTWSRVS
jgi:uncharacterized protein (DUF2147 family)